MQGDTTRETQIEGIIVPSDDQVVPITGGQTVYKEVDDTVVPQTVPMILDQRITGDLEVIGASTESGNRNFCSDWLKASKDTLDQTVLEEVILDQRISGNNTVLVPDKTIMDQPISRDLEVSNESGLKSSKDGDFIAKEVTSKGKGNTRNSDNEPHDQEVPSEDDQNTSPLMECSEGKNFDYLVFSERSDVIVKKRVAFRLSKKQKYSFKEQRIHSDATPNELNFYAEATKQRRDLGVFRYSRNELEALRFVNGKEQSKIWQSIAMSMGVEAYHSLMRMSKGDDYRNSQSSIKPRFLEVDEPAAIAAIEQWNPIELAANPEGPLEEGLAVWVQNLTPRFQEARLKELCPMALYIEIGENFQSALLVFPDILTATTAQILLHGFLPKMVAKRVSLEAKEFHDENKTYRDSRDLEFHMNDFSKESRCIIVLNVSSMMSYEDLTESLQQYGPETVDFFRHPESFAILSFASPFKAKIALDLHGSILGATCCGVAVYRCSSLHLFLTPTQQVVDAIALPVPSPDKGGGRRYDPEQLQQVLDDVQAKILPGVTHWQSPNYFACFPSNSSTAGFLGEMLSAGLNIVGFSWVTSPAATELKVFVLDWLAKMLKLPEDFLSLGQGGGVIQGTASEAILVVLLAARDNFLRRIGKNSLGKLVAYASNQAHASLQKACQIAGIHPDNCRLLKADSSTNYALSPDVLQEAISKDLAAGLVPCFLSSTVGTTSSTAVDPLFALGKVAKVNEMWFHVDAAYAGSACICPEYRHYIDGVVDADSFNMNAKWFLTNFDCSALWVKASQANTVVDFKDWQIPLGRRFRSLKLWMVLRLYGLENLQSYIRNHIALAKQFEELVAVDQRFEIVVPRSFALVCFRLLPTNNDQVCGNKLNQDLLDAVNSSGKIFISHTVLSGTYILRFVVGAPLTEERHITAVWKVLQDEATVLLGRL